MCRSILCSLCKTDLTPGGVSVHAGSIFAAGPVPWQGPFICANCKRESQAGGGEGPQKGVVRAVSAGTMLAETIQEELAATGGPPEAVGPQEAERTESNGGREGGSQGMHDHALDSIPERIGDR